MQYDLIIKNGLVILESGEIFSDVAIKNGKIAAIGPNLVQAMSGKAMSQEPKLVQKAELQPLLKCH